MKTTNGLLVFAILWIFLLPPTFADDQEPSGRGHQATDQKALPAEVGQGETNPPTAGAAAAGEEQKTVPSVTQKKALPQQTHEGNKDASPSTPAKADGSIDVINKAGNETSGDAQKTGSKEAKEEEAGQGKAPLKERPLDRRWQIKQQAGKGKTLPQKKPEPVKWQNEMQKDRCQGYREDLRSKYSKTRNYSVQGDACRTAENSEAFLSLLGAFDQECPAEFVQQSGYSETIRGNVMRLKELGTKECLRGGGGRPR